ncbi:MAG TPA: DsbC family protein [Chromatiales bacterium]|nr:DsbC family protein [Thiotrichales bacterium]HIP69230.1 DsbC family protein [Chromatiales bacterium]
MKRSILLLLCTTLSLFSIPAFAEKAAAPANAPYLRPVGNAIDMDKFKAKLAKIIPGRVPSSIKPTPLPGLYEVSYGVRIFYVSEDADYLLDGELLDLQSHTNLTQDAQARTRKAIMDKVPVDSMISFPAKGKRKHIITVFTDIDCPYCRKLHNEMDQYNDLGIEVRYMLFPRAGVGSPSFKTAVSTWCAKDNRTALTKAKNGEKIESLECKNPVADQYKVGQEIGVNGTPAIVLESGEIVPGYRPAKDIAAMLDQLASMKAEAKQAGR